MILDRPKVTAEPLTLRPGVLEDHRGKPVTVYRRRTAWRTQRNSNNPDRLTRSVLIRIGVRELLTPRGLISIAIATICLISSILALKTSLTQSALMGALAILFAIQPGRQTLDVRSSKVATALLRARLCASCGYELEGINIETDGCRVCPECGAAWRLESSAPPDARS